MANRYRSVVQSQSKHNYPIALEAKVGRLTARFRPFSVLKPVAFKVCIGLLARYDIICVSWDSPITPEPVRYQFPPRSLFS